MCPFFSGIDHTMIHDAEFNSCGFSGFSFSLRPRNIPCNDRTRSVTLHCPPLGSDESRGWSDSASRFSWFRDCWNRPPSKNWVTKSGSLLPKSLAPWP
jgi:hypothetical protein